MHNTSSIFFSSFLSHLLSSYCFQHDYSRHIGRLIIFYYAFESCCQVWFQHFRPAAHSPSRPRRQFAGNDGHFADDIQVACSIFWQPRLIWHELFDAGARAFLPNAWSDAQHTIFNLVDISDAPFTIFRALPPRRLQIVATTLHAHAAKLIVSLRWLEVFYHAFLISRGRYSRRHFRLPARSSIEPPWCHYWVTPLLILPRMIGVRTMFTGVAHLFSSRFAARLKYAFPWWFLIGCHAKFHRRCSLSLYHTRSSYYNAVEGTFYFILLSIYLRMRYYFSNSMRDFKMDDALKWAYHGRIRRWLCLIGSLSFQLLAAYALDAIHYFIFFIAVTTLHLISFPHYCIFFDFRHLLR